MCTNGPRREKTCRRVSEKWRFKPSCSGTEISYKIEISLVASLDMILFNQQITKMLISLRGCTGWSAPLLLESPKDKFSCIEAQINTVKYENIHAIMCLYMHAFSLNHIVIFDKSFVFIKIKSHLSI